MTSRTVPKNCSHPCCCSARHSRVDAAQISRRSPTRPPSHTRRPRCRCPAMSGLRIPRRRRDRDGSGRSGGEPERGPWGGAGGRRGNGLSGARRHRRYRRRLVRRGPYPGSAAGAGPAESAGTASCFFCARCGRLAFTGAGGGGSTTAGAAPRPGRKRRGPSARRRASRAEPRRRPADVTMGARALLPHPQPHGRHQRRADTGCQRRPRGGSRDERSAIAGTETTVVGDVPLARRGDRVERVQHIGRRLRPVGRALGQARHHERREHRRDARGGGGRPGSGISSTCAARVAWVERPRKGARPASIS